MRIYITRMGQPDKKGKGLTDIGIKQAEFLGKHLESLGFLGKIYSIEDVAAKETAKIISKYTKSETEIYKEISDIEDFNKLLINSDSLFIENEKGSDNLCKVLGIPVKNGMCNCTLSYLEPDKNTKRVYNDTGHLPYELRGYDYYMQSDEHKEKLEALMKMELDIPKKAPGETRIFHMGDTSSFYFPFYERLLSEIKPDIIIHTGDFSDEIKAGRIKHSRKEYTEKAPVIASILKSSGAKKIYAVCGNNDIEEVIKKELPEAEFVAPGGEVEICGIRCALGHAHVDVNKDAEWSFYGHGITGETWAPEKNNIKEGKCRFNAIWHFSIISMPERKLIKVEYPEEA